VVLSVAKPQLRTICATIDLHESGFKGHSDVLPIDSGTEEKKQLAPFRHVAYCVIYVAY